MRKVFFLYQNVALVVGYVYAQFERKSMEKLIMTAIEHW